MSTYSEHSDKRTVTLNHLNDKRYSLNMRLLLALQSGDAAIQHALEQEIAETTEQIDQMKAGCGMPSGQLR